ncbi:SRPBCC family protein [Antrihabitans cavernicola]|uniref:SRPBCC family protein n=1 Tax=Antrihabitans cavernicola TaxID=2495913 RepID=A0A5A7S6E7_9NOCA|nr:SRPBCC family protein [Spelaeibacter cavernicola]KAA0019456.1 SRPBCC family protein [Spelaeibacter cavernicola]
MTRTMTVSDSVVVAATPDAVYDKVSDPTLMGRWSPENRGARVMGEQGKTHVGMTFIGRNKRGAARWVTQCTVTAADQGERFEFRVGAIGVKVPRLPAPIATWEYRFEAVPEGTRVTETWTDDRTRWPDPVANVFDKIVTSGKTFADFQSKNIHITLRNLAKAFGPAQG